jgi:hypothetical protein
MGMLPILDFFALATMNEQHDRFLVELVESKQVRINVRSLADNALPVAHNHHITPPLSGPNPL